MLEGAGDAWYASGIPGAVVTPEVVVAAGQLARRRRAVHVMEVVLDASPVHVAEGLPPQELGRDGNGCGRRGRRRGRRRGGGRARLLRGLNLGRRLGRDGRRGGLHDGAAAVHGGEDALVEGLVVPPERHPPEEPYHDHRCEYGDGLRQLPQGVSHRGGGGLLDHQPEQLLGPVAGTGVGLRLGSGGVGGGDHHHIARLVRGEPLAELRLQLGPERREGVRVLSPGDLLVGHGGRSARQKLGLPAVVGRHGRLVLGRAILLHERVLHAEMALQDLHREERRLGLVGLRAQVDVARGQGFLAARPAGLEAGPNHERVRARVDEAYVLCPLVVVGPDPLADRLGRELRGLLELVEAPLGLVGQFVELAEALADLGAAAVDVLRDRDLTSAHDVRALPVDQREGLQLLPLDHVDFGKGPVIVGDLVLPHEAERELGVRPSLVPAFGALEVSDADRVDEILLAPVVAREELDDAGVVGVDGGSVVVRAPFRPADDGLVGVEVDGAFRVLRIVVAHGIALLLLLFEIVHSRSIELEHTGIGDGDKLVLAFVDRRDRYTLEVGVVLRRPILECLLGELIVTRCVTISLLNGTLRQIGLDAFEACKHLSLDEGVVSDVPPSIEGVFQRLHLAEELGCLSALFSSPCTFRRKTSNGCGPANCRGPELYLLSCELLDLAAHVIFASVVEDTFVGILRARDGFNGHRHPLEKVRPLRGIAQGIAQRSSDRGFCQACLDRLRESTSRRPPPILEEILYVWLSSCCFVDHRRLRCRAYRCRKSCTYS